VRHEVWRICCKNLGKLQGAWGNVVTRYDARAAYSGRCSSVGGVAEEVPREKGQKIGGRKSLMQSRRVAKKNELLKSRVKELSWQVL